MKSNQKILNWVLGVVLLCIWGGVGYQIIRSLHSGDESESGMDRELSNNNASKVKIFHYTADIRDPFQFAIPVAHHELKKIPPSKPAAVAPQKFPLRLLGIVNNDKKQTAILESDDGTVSFLAKGDTLQGVKILSIDKDVVRYIFLNAQGELTLNRQQ